ncbi:MAG: hypothetical protein KBT12_09075 [Bacteroidales bacterium]|nr:hypothetical protein [Candidatus Physcousia equi]
MNRLIVILTTILMLASCNKQEAMLSDPKEEARRDSAALHVAVYPSEACLPLYFADATGIFDSLGVDIRLLCLPSMEDCDTVLLHHRAEVASTDYGRIVDLRRLNCRATAIATQPTSLSLITAKGKRITQVKQLRDRLVCIDRHSESDRRCDQQVAAAGIDQLDVFRTQFNRHRLRHDMLLGGLVDAAFLDRPYSTHAQTMGNNCIWQRTDAQQSWTVLAAPLTLFSDSSRMKQVRRLIAGCQIAIEQINKGEKRHQLMSTIKKHYELPHAAVDTIAELTPAHLFPLTPPVATQAEEARQWLVDRKWITSSLNTDSLTTPLFFEK